MLAKRVIPCLDVDRGRVVKGVHFFDHVDAGDPIEQAREYDRQGADELVFYDITASAEYRDIILDLVRQVAQQIFIPFTVGGGVRTIEDIRDILKAGADKVSINTAAVEDPDIINRGAERFGSQCIVASMDIKRKVPNAPTDELEWEIYTHGGRVATGMEALGWARELEQRGAGEYVVNSMDADGTKMGYDVELTRRISENASIPVVASGGAGTLEHMYEVLVEGKADAVLAASIFHFQELTVQEVKQYLAQKGVPVRLL
ncbi:MAG: imidazole glycerol phosphate synthase subunit HisF [Armatimonadota bacterium]